MLWGCEIIYDDPQGLEPPPAVARNRLNYEVVKLFTVSPYFRSLFLKLKFDLPRRVRKEV